MHINNNNNNNNKLYATCQKYKGTFFKVRLISLHALLPLPTMNQVSHI